MKIALLGLGRIGMVYAEELLQTAEVEVLAYSPTQRKRFRPLVGNSRFSFSSDFAKILASDCDAFIIATPSTTHLDYLKALVPLGKPIFCEKPVDLLEKNIHKVQRWQQQYQTPVLVGFNRRFDPQVRRMKAKIEDGHIGNIHIVKLTGRDPAPPSKEFARHSGGLFLDMMIHDFDMVRHLTAAEPVSVYAKADLKVAKSFAEFGDVDTAICIVKMSDGALVTIDNSRKATYGYDQRLEVFGSKGMIQIPNQRHDHTVVCNKSGTHRSPLKNFFMDRYLSSYQEELRHFLSVVRDPKTSVAVSLHDAWMATRMGVAARKSSQSGREILLK